MQTRLQDPCRFLKGVGPRRARALERLGIHTVEDLLLHLPRSYYDRRRLLPVAALQPGTEHACVRARVESLEVVPPRRGRSVLRAELVDETGRLRVVWYNVRPREILQPGNLVVLNGSVVRYRGRLEMRHPEFERLDSESQELVHSGRIVPLYALTQSLSQRWLRSLVRRTLDTHLHLVEEVLPDTARRARPLRAEAFRAAHFPESMEESERARDRLKYEELFFLQLLMARRRAHNRSESSGLRMRRDRGLHERYRSSLPFRFTGAQERVLEEIYRDLESGQWMQRLVQGDVGAGKTVVAISALFFAIGNGWQGVLMAPTEALALQHAERLVRVCSELDVRMGVLTGSRTEREKQVLRARMESGEVDLVVGTHALIQEGIRWARLGLAVVDEQQRFGVLQRGTLQRQGHKPHVLVLTATPIPRSLALGHLGDLDVSRLDEKPPGRTPVRTHLVPPERRGDMLRFVREELEAGRQGYMVFPLIEESDKLDLRAATREFERLDRGPLAGLRLGLLHGRLPGAEKEALLERFRRGDLQLLVATSVVEVGLDVGNASFMIVHHPERFGLSQLHQLRGRVGRGRGVSYCFLLSDTETGEEITKRLREFTSTDDGFRIAELDLKIRGPGDFVGTRQHGLPPLRIADLARDLPILEKARRDAFGLVQRDPDLEADAHRSARVHLETRYADRQALAEIG